MADGTSIEWTDATVNVVNGCSVCSPGCANCYAMRAGARNLPGHPSTGLTQPSKAGHVWTGEVRFNETALLQPLRWRRPRRIFWNAHGDLFHDSVPDAWIDRCFAVMALTPQHQHQVLTKRSARMRAYMTRLSEMWHDAGDPFDDRMGTLLVELSGSPCAISTWEDEFVLPNVWLGVSVEDQTRADERILDLLATPAAVRFVSCEPLLGPVDLGRVCLVPKVPKSARAGIHVDVLQARYVESGLPYIGEWDVSGPLPPNAPCLALDWVIVGGESGAGARPMHPDWARALRDQCAAAGVPFLFKQWGSCLPGGMTGEDERGNPAYEIDEEHCEVDYDDLGRGSPIGAHAQDFIRFKHKRTGRLLDGQHHDGMPA